MSHQMIHGESKTHRRTSASQAVISRANEESQTGAEKRVFLARRRQFRTLCEDVLFCLFSHILSSFYIWSPAFHEPELWVQEN